MFCGWRRRPSAPSRRRGVRWGAPGDASLALLRRDARAVQALHVEGRDAHRGCGLAQREASDRDGEEMLVKFPRRCGGIPAALRDTLQLAVPGHDAVRFSDLAVFLTVVVVVVSRIHRFAGPRC